MTPIQIIQTVAVLVTCTVSVGGILVYIGRSLGALDSIKKAVEAALTKTDEHSKDISTLKERLGKVETRQEDCTQCP